MTNNFLVFFSALAILFSLRVQALVGLESLESKLIEKNQELLSLKEQIEAKETLYSSGRSGFYPVVNIVGGWAQNKTDDLTVTQKGSVGYVEGRYNIFNGFKDQSGLNQKDTELKLAKIELVTKTRKLRLLLTETLSDMIRIHRLQKILEEEFEITQIQKQMAAKKVSAGLTSTVDNLEFNLRESEIQIERNQIEQLHNEVHQKLVILYGEDVSEVELDKLTFSSFDDLITSTKIFSVENNPDYQKSELNLSKAESEKKIIRSDFFPKLDFTYSVGRLTPSENSPIKYDESKYGITLTLPLFSGFDTYYKTKAAGFEVLAAEKLKFQKKNDVQAEFNILKNKVHELRELYKINEFKLTNSQKYFDMTNVEYKRGVKNSPDLVGATERWFLSKKKKYEILKDLEILKVKIESL